MQLPLLPGTILQNRYCLLQVLGQGGFGRTYLVKDQARFNELCVLKEYTPKHTGIYVLEKSKELFQREAETLYKIQHPQIPQFRATFEEDERLFLMQDYIEGKTYRTLLSERHKQGQTFSENEMLDFLFNILPVLEYIHNKGIIHRDISPENLMFRQSDKMPVLIDFGTVKHNVFSVVSTEGIPPETVVGKVGYAPEEQLIKGEVSPNSDIYAVGITVIVLMTGRKTQDFFDDFLRNRCWQKNIPSVSRLFAMVLDRMINPIPSHRYQSATELLQTLRSLKELFPSPLSPIPNPPNPPQPIPSPEHKNPSTIRHLQKTIFSLGKRIISGSFLEKSIVAIGAGLILLFIILVPKEQAKLSPKPEPTFAPEPTSTPESAQTQPPPIILQGKHLVAKQPFSHYIEIKPGQQINAFVKEGRVFMTLYKPNKEPLIDRITNVNDLLLAPGIYTFEVHVNENEGITESDYQIEVRLYDIP